MRPTRCRPRLAASGSTRPTSAVASRPVGRRVRDPVSGKAGRFGTFITGVTAIKPERCLVHRVPEGAAVQCRSALGRYVMGSRGDSQPGKVPERARRHHLLRIVGRVGRGSLGAYGGSDSLVEHWNGTAWTVSKVPHPSGTNLHTGRLLVEDVHRALGWNVLDSRVGDPRRGSSAHIGQALRPATSAPTQG